MVLFFSNDLGLLRIGHNIQSFLFVHVYNIIPAAYSRTKLQLHQAVVLWTWKWIWRVQSVWIQWKKRLQLYAGTFSAIPVLPVRSTFRKNVQPADGSCPPVTYTGYTFLGPPEDQSSVPNNFICVFPLRLCISLTQLLLTEKALEAVILPGHLET